MKNIKILENIDNDVKDILLNKEKGPPYGLY